MWKLEKKFLDDIVKRYFPCYSISHLDFACGTGRILKYLEGRTDSSVGVDLSEEMLCMARKEVPQAEIIQADLTREDVLGDRRFNLITAFRFFPNAQPELRMEAMHVLVKHLTDSGYIVFNNHLNSSSLLHRIQKDSAHGMNEAEMLKLVLSNGLRIINVYHGGVLPTNETRAYLPGHMLLAVETVASRFQTFRTYAQNLVYVCTHA